jgi:hypothetical protein
MPINLLIDTSTLYTLLNIIEHDWNLQKIDGWLTLGEIRLCVPAILREEWEDKKKIRLNGIEEQIKRIEKDFKLRHGLEINIDTGSVIAEKRTRDQIQIIDSWLANGYNFNPGPKSIQATQYQKSSQLPPFQGGKESEKDATIIFSTMEKLVDEGATELFFVSENISDFCMKENDKQVIHSAIQERFPTIKIHFAVKLNSFVNHAISNGFLSRIPLTISNNHNVYERIYVDKSLHLIDQLNNYLKARFVNFTFLPRSLYAKHYPFIIDHGRDIYDRPFTLVTNNKVLYEFLLSVAIKEEGIVQFHIEGSENVDQVDKKITEIVKKLSSNFIHFVSFKTKLPKRLAFIAQQPVNSLTETYRDLKWLQLMASLETVEGDELSLQMEKAFLKYRLGDYVGSAEQYKRVRIQADRQNNHDITFLATFSLSKLAPFIRTQNYDNTQSQLLAAELDTIDLERAVKIYETKENKELLGWLFNNRFISETSASLSETVLQIAQLEHNKSAGHNTHFQDILNVYFEVEYFLSRNFVVFDKFSDFSTLTNSFLQGLFASYSSSKRIQLQVEEFEPYLLETLIFHDKSEDIKYHMSVYKVKNIKYAKGDSDYFETTILPFLQHYNALTAESSSYAPNVSISFMDEMERIFANILLLTAVTEFTPELKEKLLYAISEIIHATGPDLNPTVVSQLNYIFYKENGTITDMIAEKFLKTLLLQKFVQRSGIYVNLTRILIENGRKIGLSDEEFLVLDENWWSPQEKEYDSPEILLPIAALLQSRAQTEAIKSRIDESFTDHFRSDAFYLAYLSDMIEPTLAQIHAFEEQLRKRLQPPDTTAVLRQAPLRFPHTVPVDRYIHYSMDAQRDIPDDIKAAIVSLGPYYAWIFDLDAFDYIRFEAEWLDRDLSKALKRKLQSSEALRTHFIESLKSNRDAHFALLFFEIFHT